MSPNIMTLLLMGYFRQALVYSVNLFWSCRGLFQAAIQLFSIISRSEFHLVSYFRSAFHLKRSMMTTVTVMIRAMNLEPLRAEMEGK